MARRLTPEEIAKKYPKGIIELAIEMLREKGG